MPRRRVIDPSLWQDEGFAELSAQEKNLFIGLFSNADDDGRLPGSASAIRLMLPAVYGGASLEAIEADLANVLSRMRRLTRYEVDGRFYLAFTNWGKWQKIDRPSPSDLPPPPDGARPFDEPSPQPSIEGSEKSTNDPRTILEQSTSVPPSRDSRERKLKEVKGKEEKGREATAPHDLTASLNAMNAVLMPLASRGYVPNKDSLTKCAAKYPAIDLELEALKLADWLNEPRNRKELCSWRRIFNWLDRAEHDRQRREAERRTQDGGSKPRPFPEDLPKFETPLQPAPRDWRNGHRGGPPTKLGTLLPQPPAA